MENRATPPTQAKLMFWIIWAALAFSIIIYFVVLKTVATGSEEVLEKPDQSIVLVLAGVGLLSIAVSLGIRILLVNPRIGKLAPGEIMKVFPHCIISWALAEAVGIYGLVLGFMGHPIGSYGLFFVTSFCTMLFLAPTFARLVRVLPDAE